MANYFDYFKKDNRYAAFRADMLKQEFSDYKRIDELQKKHKLTDDEVADLLEEMRDVEIRRARTYSKNTGFFRDTD